MTVGELKEILKTFPNSQEVILSIDEEGNAFHPLDECTSHWWFPKWGKIRDDEDMEESDKLHHQRALVLWP